MPRKAKGKQPPRAANDQAYGARNEAMIQQRQMPLPESRIDPASVGPAPGPPGPPMDGPPMGGPGGPPTDPLAAMAAFSPNVTPLNAPSLRESEPITAGLAMGDGPGPEALGLTQAPPRESAVVRTLSVMARTNPNIEKLLADAVRRGQ